MPYVPSKKTKPPAEDRKVLDPVIDVLAHKVAEDITGNLTLIGHYVDTFESVIHALNDLLSGKKVNDYFPAQALALAIFQVSEKYEYEGAPLGELNYSITRFIQRVPQIKIDIGDWEEELRYWLYAATVESLILAEKYARHYRFGAAGVFEDIKDEYKWRVNRAYEAAQIVKSGDCYDTPYYTKLVEVVDEYGNHIGYTDVYLKRSEKTLNRDVLGQQLVLKTKLLEYNM